MFIVRVTAVTDELRDVFKQLLPQLNSSLVPPSVDELEALISAESTILLAARFPDKRAKISGLLGLVIYHVPTGIRARVEDVIVEEAMRGNGIGEALVRYALNMAREANADGVALTSNPKRKAANQLYQKLGFKPWQTNLYFYKF
ncbi:MAG: GNAT family N-acetyltransferase [Anaerolineae bacterium]|nr:GNAT family N-acetyltransferase [Anaerolineae bacterium]